MYRCLYTRNAIRCDRSLDIWNHILDISMLFQFSTLCFDSEVKYTRNKTKQTKVPEIGRDWLLAEDNGCRKRILVKGLTV